MVIRVALQLGRRLEPVEIPTIRLDGIKFTNGREARLVSPRVGWRRVGAVCGGGRGVW
jgi:hypothetical protein